MGFHAMCLLMASGVMHFLYSGQDFLCHEDRSKDHQARETLYRDQLRPSHSRKEISFQEGLVLLAFLVLQRHRYKTAVLSRAV